MTFLCHIMLGCTCILAFQKGLEDLYMSIAEI
jgi:hypothetical protein